jgi:membrane fusion protein, multidrug efflux system
VPEPAAAYVRPGTQVRFQTEAVPGAEFQAVVTQLNPALDMRSRSLNAEARISGADARLKPGMFVQVEIMAGRSESVAVPEKAIQTVAGLRKVFVVRERKAKELRIVPGASSEGWVEVDDGNLKAGDQVALDQLARLTDGAEVEVVR